MDCDVVSSMVVIVSPFAAIARPVVCPFENIGDVATSIELVIGEVVVCGRQAGGID